MILLVIITHAYTCGHPRANRIYFVTLLYMRIFKGKGIYLVTLLHKRTLNRKRMSPSICTWHYYKCVHPRGKKENTLWHYYTCAMHTPLHTRVKLQYVWHCACESSSLIFKKCNVKPRTIHIIHAIGLNSSLDRIQVTVSGLIKISVNMNSIVAVH